MSTFAEFPLETPRPVPALRYRRKGGKVRALVHAALASLSSWPEETEEPRVSLARQEAVIAAARSAFGGTIAW